jgi:hypothetical protein
MLQATRLPLQLICAARRPYLIEADQNAPCKDTIPYGALPSS